MRARVRLFTQVQDVRNGARETAFVREGVEGLVIVVGAKLIHGVEVLDAQLSPCIAVAEVVR